jgi:hypothetical protein
MKKVGKYVGIAALIAVIGLVAVGAVAFAQEPDESGETFSFFERFRQNLAGLLGISVEEYDSAVEQAQEQTLDEAVAEGWLTQEQADQMRERMEQAPGMRPWGRMDKGFGRHGRGISLLSVAADELGMSHTDLMAELHDGKTIADVASERGLDPQTIADAYIAQLSEHLSQAVEDERLTQRMADSMLEQAKEQVDEQLNSIWEDCGPGGPHGGRGDDRFRDMPEQNDS